MIEELIKELIKSINGLNATIQGARGEQGVLTYTTGEVIPEKTTKAKAEKPAKAKASEPVEVQGDTPAEAPEVADEPEAAQPAVTIIELRALGAKVVAVPELKGQFKDWLTAKGAKSLTTLEESLYGECYEYMTELLEGGK